METTTANGDVREFALRCIGRNVVNFQKLEHCLKSIALLQRIEGSISEVESEQEKRKATAAKHTLGKAIQEWRVAVSEEQMSGGAIADLFEPWISMKFDFGVDKEAIADQSNALVALATERNNLIHHDLVSIDLDSAAQCKELIRRLDDQNSKILEQLRMLAPFRTAIRDLAIAMRSSFESEEFLNQLDRIESQKTI